MSQWRGVLNQILYALHYAKELDDSVVDGVADIMMDRRMLAADPDTYYGAITQALATREGTLLGEDSIPTEHQEPDLRDYLRRLRDRLDAMRPWPPARFVKLPPDQWPGFAETPAIGKIDRAPGTVSEHVWEDFDKVSVNGVDTPVLLVRTRSGEVLSLLGSTEPGRRPAVTVHVLEGDPASALRSFRELANFREEQIKPLPRP